MGKKKSSSTTAGIGIVGPDYIQVLSGTIASKSIRLILCGESHSDAIDVTRKDGGVVKEGWVLTDIIELMGMMVGKFDGDGNSNDRNDDGNDENSDAGIRVRVGICKRNNKPLSLGKAKEWGREVGLVEIEYIPPGGEMVFLWVPSKDGLRGSAYFVELSIDDGNADDDDDDSGKKRTKSRAHLPPDVANLLDQMSNVAKQMKDVKSLSKVVNDLKDELLLDNNTNHYVLLQWTDMDDVARKLNHRRLLGDDISETEHDTIIRDRASKLRSVDGVWTWDDWLVDVRSKLLSSSSTSSPDDDPSLHLVLESAIPPWEVEMCREAIVPNFEYEMASDCVRCLSEDSDYSEMDAHDPSSDGFGSYLDYVHRRFMEIEREVAAKSNDSDAGIITSSSFMHCVDCRDLGCKQSCVDEKVRNDWIALLSLEERSELLSSGTVSWGLTLEDTELQRLQVSGKHSKESATTDDDTDHQVDECDIVTFPSFEKYFGQCTDVMYYTPNYKVAFAPFLARCVKSVDTWNSFFVELFFGGTVAKALSMLDLSTGSSRSSLHVRSSIITVWNEKTGEYELRKREDDGEEELSLTLLPIKSFLMARGSSPVKTWSSSLFTTLLENDSQELRDFACHVRDWALNDIARHCDNPKLNDDEVGGGEWFLAYLRQCHREIYDDIDRSDCAELLRKRNVQGEKKKHKIGDINIPSCTAGFRLIKDELLRIDDGKVGKPIFSHDSEVMAKILIDIYMNKLVDVASLMKIGQLIAKEDTKRNIVIVVYMGSVHTRSICNFFTQPTYNFKKKIFCGKQDWGYDEAKIIHIPSELKNIKELFK